MSEEAVHTKDSLIALAHAEGWRGVTPQRFDRWRRAGLVPSPDRRWLGRGKGSVSSYPSRSAEQLLRVCGLHLGPRGERRLRYLAWRLWWEGYEVPLPRVREFIVKDVVHRLDRQLAHLRESSAEDRQKAAREVATKRLGRKSAGLGKARQRLRSQSAPFLAWLGDALSGSVADDAGSKRRLEKATGLDRSRTDDALGRPLLADEVDYMPTVTASAAAIGESLSERHVAQFADVDLCAARDQVQSFFLVMRDFVGFARDVGGKRGLGVGDWYAPEDPMEQAAFVLVWPQLVQLGQQSPEVTNPNEATAVLCSLTEPYRLIQEQRRVEVFRDLLSTERLLAARSDNESWREYVRELRRTARDHSQEVQAFCEAHPELGQLLAEESAADT